MYVDRAHGPIFRSPLVVAGGSEGTGRLVASLAMAQGREVRVVDTPEHTASLRSAMVRVGGVVLVPARRVESVAGQVQVVLHACDDSAPTASPVVLVSGFSVGHGSAHALNTPERLKDRVAAEELVRSSGRPYAIVRPTWLTADPPGR